MAVDCFTVVHDLPSLQELSAYQVALTVRLSDHSRCTFSSNETAKFYENLNDRYLSSLTSSISLSSVILKMIKYCLEKIEDELSAWLHHVSNGLFGAFRRRYVIGNIDINWCIWSANGEIDYVKTALTMLENGDLNSEQKFCVYCEYGLEDLMKNIPFDSLPHLNYHLDDVMFYWICVRRGTLNEIPQSGYDSAESAMANNFRRYDRFTIEYFWRRSDAANQLRIIKSLIASRWNDRRECAVWERLISTMSFEQQLTLLHESWASIVINFSIHPSNGCPLWAWNFAKRIITDEKFAQVIEALMKQWMRLRKDCPVVMQIWNEANIRQRSLTFASKVITIDKIMLFALENPDFALEFVIEFIHKFSSEEKVEICFRLGKNLKSRCFDLSILNVIVTECLPHADDKLKFIRLLKRSHSLKEYFCCLIDTRKFEYFNSVMKYYFNDNRESEELKLEMVRSMKFNTSESVICITNASEWGKLSNFIDEIFSDNVEHALEEKQRIVELAIQSKHFANQFHLRFDIQETFHIVESIFKKEKLINIKRRFAHAYGETLKTRSYWENEKVGETYFLNILSWCLQENEESIRLFKTEVSHEVIYDRYFCWITRLYTQRNFEANNLEVVLNHLNCCYLNWYFAHEHELTEFKLRKLAEFRKRPLFKLILNKNDREILRNLVNWFCDGDIHEIDKFLSEM